MRARLAVAAALLALLGTVAAMLWLALLSALHVARSPDRLLKAAYVAVFCGLGYLAG